MREEAKAKWSAAFARSSANVSAANAAGVVGDVENGGEVLYSEEYENFDENKDILKLIEKVKTGKFKDNDKVYFDNVSSEIADEIKQITGIDVSGFRMAIEARQIKHILRRHGVNGLADSSMRDDSDIAKMEFVLYNPGDLSDGGTTTAYTTNDNGKFRLAKTVSYEKQIGDSIYFVAQAVPDTKAKTLYIVTTYMSKTKEEALQLADALNPDATSDTLSAVTSSKNSLSQNATDVNSSENLYSEYEDTSMREVLSGTLLETAQSNAERSTASRFPAVTHQLNIGSITARKYSVIVSGLSAILREIQ